VPANNASRTVAGTIRAPFFAADTQRGRRPAAGKGAPWDAEHPTLPRQWVKACGERLVPCPGVAVTSSMLLGWPRLCPRGWDPGSTRCAQGLSSQQLLPARAQHRWCFTGKDWDTLEEGLGLPSKVGWGKGPRSGAHSQNRDSFDN